MAKRGEVFLAEAKLADTKRPLFLPVIVLSDEAYNSSGFVLAVPIAAKRGGHCLPIGWGDCDCELAPGSAVQTDAMLKLYSSQLVKRIGRVEDGFYWKLVNRIRGLIE